MAGPRLIARLDVKAPNLIKGIHLEGLRVIGDPAERAKKYYAQGVDEIIYMDVVASLYGRNLLADLVAKTGENVFVPMTVGGGIRSEEDAKVLLRAGADKVAINTSAIRDPKLITSVSERFGSQAMVLSIEAKRTAPDSWEAYTDNGREKTGKDVVEWAKEGASLGAGEILLTSVDQEGTRKGFDLNLIRAVAQSVEIPVIASGGMGGISDAATAVLDGAADAVAFADILHYDRATVGAIRESVRAAGIESRETQ